MLRLPFPLPFRFPLHSAQHHQSQPCQKGAGISSAVASCPMLETSKAQEAGEPSPGSIQAELRSASLLCAPIQGARGAHVFRLPLPLPLPPPRFWFPLLLPFLLPACSVQQVSDWKRRIIADMTRVLQQYGGATCQHSRTVHKA